MVIENIAPIVDGGRFAVKRSVGEMVQVQADAFADGHDLISVVLRYRTADPGPLAEWSGQWSEVRMSRLPPVQKDRWQGEFPVHLVGWHEFTIVGWIDRFGTWRADLQKRVAAGQNVKLELLIGADLIDEAAAIANAEGTRALSAFANMLRGESQRQAIQIALCEPLAELMRQHVPRRFASEWPQPVRVWADRPRARFSAWYELFPRSASPDPRRHGTLADVQAKLDHIADMGFDVLYLPPIHPIGRAFRKGRNNMPTAEPGDVGSPWAVGGPEGGHDAIHPELGTFEDFDRLIAAAREHEIEIALDMAFQCSPDHPYVRQHPEWFVHRPDGSIQYAENPPKKYQDIYPFDFECEQWRALWNELLRVVLHWVSHGVRIFRVDNPHTKPFPFWEWLIAQVKEREPDVLFLAEAFTRPKVMYRLGKLGFTQSYTYFAWRNDPWNLREYFEELTAPPVVDFYRPNAWPNTPDILSGYLQTDARAAHAVRAILAATLCANYGVYGPAFEQMEHRPVRPGSEEYLDSEKYQIRHWNDPSGDSLADLLSQLNRIRRAYPALQQDRTLVFHETDNPKIICFSKTLPGQDSILVAASTDPYNQQWANLQLDLPALGLPYDRPFDLRDLLTGNQYRWRGSRATVGINPADQPAHIFAIPHRGGGGETDFDYYE